MAAVVGETDANGVTRLISAGVPVLVQTAADYTVLAGESLVEVTDVSATRTITLPSARLNPGQQVTVKDGSGFANGSHKVTVATAALTPDTNQLRWRQSLAVSGENAIMRLATVAALPTCAAAGSGVGKTLTASAIGALSIDGTAVAATDAVLVKDQADPVDNGIYTVTAPGHAASYVMDTDLITFTSSAGTATVTLTRATAAVLPNTPTYSGGAKTLTAGSNAQLSVDGGVMVNGETVLVKDQADAKQNGIYTVTTQGSGAAAWVLTRNTSYDTSGELNAAIGTIFAFTAGTANSAAKFALDNPQAVFLLTRKTTFDQSNEVVPGYLVTMSAGSTLSGQYWVLRGGIDDAPSVSITTALDKLTVISNGVAWRALE